MYKTFRKNSVLLITGEVFIPVKEILLSKKGNQLLCFFWWVFFFDVSGFHALSPGSEAVHRFHPPLDANLEPQIEQDTNKEYVVIKKLWALTRSDSQAYDDRRVYSTKKSLLNN